MTHRDPQAEPLPSFSSDEEMTIAAETGTPLTTEELDRIAAEHDTFAEGYLEQARAQAIDEGAAGK